MNISGLPEGWHYGLIGGFDHPDSVPYEVSYYVGEDFRMRIEGCQAGAALHQWVIEQGLPHKCNGRPANDH